MVLTLLLPDALVCLFAEDKRVDCQSEIERCLVVWKNTDGRGIGIFQHAGILISSQSLLCGFGMFQVLHVELRKACAWYQKKNHEKPF